MVAPLDEYQAHLKTDFERLQYLDSLIAISSELEFLIGGDGKCCGFWYIILLQLFSFFHSTGWITSHGWNRCVQYAGG